MTLPAQARLARRLTMRQRRFGMAIARIMYSPSLCRLRCCPSGCRGASPWRRCAGVGRRSVPLSRRERHSAWAHTRPSAAGKASPRGSDPRSAVSVCVELLGSACGVVSRLAWTWRWVGRAEARAPSSCDQTDPSSDERDNQASARTGDEMREGRQVGRAGLASQALVGVGVWGGPTSTLGR